MGFILDKDKASNEVATLTDIDLKFFDNQFSGSWIGFGEDSISILWQVPSGQTATGYPGGVMTFRVDGKDYKTISTHQASENPIVGPSFNEGRVLRFAPEDVSEILNNQPRLSLWEWNEDGSDANAELIMHFFSTFDDHETQVSVRGVTMKGNWLIFEVEDDRVPNRSGIYKVEMHTTTYGDVHWSDLIDPWSLIEINWDDVQGLSKDLKFAETVGEIKNATNEFVKKFGRTIEYKEYSRTSSFKEQSRNRSYKEQARTETFDSQSRDTEYKTNY